MRSICLISSFSLYELFLAFIATNSTGNLINSFFGVKIINYFPFFTSSSSMGCISTNSSSLPSSGDIYGIDLFSSASHSIGS